MSNSAPAATQYPFCIYHYSNCVNKYLTLTVYINLRLFIKNPQKTHYYYSGVMVYARNCCGFYGTACPACRIPGAGIHCRTGFRNASAA